mmetsp:Transcript_17205/g.49932  ORF Transcript_17205/g.49932 Transcript_17205/m.49932 type:complete len:318 (-) Transcript_17205:2692-3645(-)
MDWLAPVVVVSRGPGVLADAALGLEAKRVAEPDEARPLSSQHIVLACGLLEGSKRASVLGTLAHEFVCACLPRAAQRREADVRVALLGIGARAEEKCKLGVHLPDDALGHGGFDVQVVAKNCAELLGLLLAPVSLRQVVEGPRHEPGSEDGAKANEASLGICEVHCDPQEGFLEVCILVGSGRLVRALGGVLAGRSIARRHVVVVLLLLYGILVDPNLSLPTNCAVDGGVCVAEGPEIADEPPERRADVHLESLNQLSRVEAPEDGAPDAIADAEHVSRARPLHCLGQLRPRRAPLLREGGATHVDQKGGDVELPRR